MTTQQSIQIEIDKEKRRQSRIDNLLSTMPLHQGKLFEQAQHQLALGLARAHPRLSQLVVQHIVDGLILDPECLCSISGGVNELPTTSEGWTNYARRASATEPLAVLSIEASDATLKEEIRAAEIQAMRPERRIQMARSGELDAHLENVIKSTLEARAGV